MIKMNSLDEHIKNKLEEYYSEKEKPDVFPSIFNLQNESYYFFTFAPAEEQLIMKTNGEVPTFEDIKYIALTATSYNHSIESLVKVGIPWSRPIIKKKYTEVHHLLMKIIEKFPQMPRDIQKSWENFKMTSDILVSKQIELENSVELAKKLWESTNTSKVVTQNDHDLMRNYLMTIASSALTQNKEQIRTVKDREIVLKYLENHMGLFNFSVRNIYKKLRDYHKDMMKDTEENIVEMERLTLKVDKDIPLDRQKNTQDIWDHLRNKRVM